MHCLCRPSRIMSVRINLLDETDFVHEIKDDLPGQALLDVVFARLNLIETSFFGIRYIDEENQTHWLDPASRISRQLKPKADAYDLYFGVKFYAADPCKLVEEITRYQLFLQVKQDVLQGRLPVAFELAAELGAFVVQSELGDYDQRRHSKGYVSEFRLLPNQSSELETRVSELHQQLKGMSPAAAELNYLDKVKWHDMYGVDLHPVLGEDSVEYFLGLTPSGIVVLRNKTTVAHYYWPRIAKVYYKGRYFMLRISDKNNELSTYGFETPRKSACKHLWRCCVEHHAFFRLMRVPPSLPNSPTNTSDIFQLGSRLKCSKDKSSKEALFINRSPPAFVRVPSKRQPRRIMDDFLSGCKKPEFGSSAFLNAKNASNYESPYRSTYSIPTSLGINPYHHQPSQHTMPHSQSNYNNNGGGGGSTIGSGNGNNNHMQAPDSPRSTRSAPWPRTQQRSLFGTKPSSPRSVRSASTTGGVGGGGGGGGGSVVGGSSNGHHHHHSHHTHSRSSQRDHVSTSSTTHQQRYRSSSVESHSSNDSRSTRRHKHRHRRTSDNESELSRGSGRSARSHHRKHRRSRHRRDSAGSDHESTRGRSYSGHRSSTARSVSAVGSHSELVDSSTQWREAQRRQQEASLGQSSVQQASVSKSSMVARSLHSNDSHSDTHSHHKSRRHKKNKSPSDSRNRIWNSELAKHLQFDLVDTAGMTEDQLREIPYTVVETTSKRSNSNIRIHKSNSKNSVGGKSTGSGNTITNGSGSISGHGKNRVDRIRGLCYQNSNPNDSNGAKNGSIRSASTISSRECDRNSGLVRMMSSMSMGDFISPTGSNLSPMENSALRVSHEHTDSGLGADQDYAYSSERSSDSTRYGTNKSSGASSGSHRKSSINGGGNSQAYNSLMQQTVSNQKHQQHQHHQQQQQHQQQQNRQNSFYGGNRRHHESPSGGAQPKPNYSKYSSTNQHQSHHPQHQHQQQQHQSVNTSCGAAVNSHLVTTSTPKPNPHPHRSDKDGASSTGAEKSLPSHRLLNYTTFENNQYKFSLNNAGRPLASGGGSNGSISANSSNGAGGGGIGPGGSLTNTPHHRDHFVEWPNTPAAPYYYQGPSSVALHAKRRDAKSDLGVPTRRLSGQAITKTQLLTGGGNYPPLGTMGYPLMGAQYPGIGFNSRLHPAKSDLFLAYPTNNEYEPPFIYNYKMPHMPEFVRNTVKPQTQQQQQQTQSSPQQQQHQLSSNPNQQPQTSAYHISGAQTADPLPPNLYKPPASSNSNASNATLYAGAAPATDVMYYQFDNTCVAPPPAKPQPIVQQPKALQLGKTSGGSPAHNIGPLVFLQHPQQAQQINSAASSTNAAMPQTSTTTTTCITTNTNNTNNTIGNDRLHASGTNNSTSHSLSTTCSEDDLEEIDEEPSRTEEDDDELHHNHHHRHHGDHDSYDDKSEVSYDEYDDGASISNINNNNNSSSGRDGSPESPGNGQPFGSSSPTIRQHPVSVAHRFNLDNCNAINNNQRQYQPAQAPQLPSQSQQPSLLSPNANTSLNTTTPFSSSTATANASSVVPASCSTAMNSNNIVITTQPLSFTTTNTNCNNIATIPTNNTAVNTTAAVTGGNVAQQQLLLQQHSINSPMQSLQQIENLHSNSNSNFNLNSPQIPKTSTSHIGNNTGSSKTLTTTATTSSSSPTSPSTSSTTSATTNAMQTIQNQLQNQNQTQNISSSLEIILSPIILSSRRAQS